MEKGKKELTAKSITLEIIKIMDYAGCNPEKRTPIRIFIGLCHAFCTGLVVFLMTLNSFLTRHHTVVNFAEDNLMLFGFLQIFAKCATGYMQRSTFYKLLNIVWNEFRTSETFKVEEQVTIQKYYKLVKFSALFYRNSIMTGIIVFILQATFKGGRNLVMDIWIPNKELLKITPYYEIVYCLEVFMFLTSALIFILPVDMLYIAMIGLVYVQIKMLKWNLQKLKTNEEKSDNYKIIVQCVAHHDMLLRFLQEFESLYSGMFLPTIASNLLLLTLTMYGTVMDEVLSRKLSFLVVCLAVIIQLFCYCFAGSLIQDEALSVAHTAYNSNWTQITDPKIRMGLKLIILRSQRRVNLTIGGIIVMNMQNFTSILRVAFSFLTFIVNVRT